MRVGYARVSTRDQHPQAQHDALLAAGCDPGHIYLDTVSGKLARRPELDKVLLVLREGDQLAVTKLDRLGRSLAHLIALSAELQQHGVDLVVLDQGIDTSTAAGCLSNSPNRNPPQPSGSVKHQAKPVWKASSGTAQAVDSCI
jgi:DNA invertase Pin-like site-specific DNA recombinase